MSRTKSCEERKESRSIYLTISDWDFLSKEGHGYPTRLIREMICERRRRIKDNNGVSDGPRTRDL